MTITTRTSATDYAGQIRGDVRQLTEPIHIAVRGRVITHDPLLDQLRSACERSPAANRPERHVAPRSCPPVALDPLDALALITFELSAWRVRLQLPRALTTYATLRRLPDAAPDLPSGTAGWLAVEVREWWRLAVIHTGWTIRDCLNVR